MNPRALPVTAEEAASAIERAARVGAGVEEAMKREPGTAIRWTAIVLIVFGFLGFIYLWMGKPADAPDRYTGAEASRDWKAQESINAATTLATQRTNLLLEDVLRRLDRIEKKQDAK